MTKTNQKATKTPENKANEVVSNTEETMVANVDIVENKKGEKVVTPKVPKFSKAQILASKWFTHRRDILSVLLEDDKEYSHAEVDKILGEFLKGKVK